MNNIAITTSMMTKQFRARRISTELRNEIKWEERFIIIISIVLCVALLGCSNKWFRREAKLSAKPEKIHSEVSKASTTAPRLGAA